MMSEYVPHLPRIGEVMQTAADPQGGHSYWEVVRVERELQERNLLGQVIQSETVTIEFLPWQPTLPDLSVPEGARLGETAELG